jgi:hypothetical protein
MIVKSTSSTDDWAVYHQSLGNTKRLVLNSDVAQITSDVWNSTTPTSTVFTVSDNARTNSNGTTYVAYLFAHNAGGFGLTGTDNVISCGSYTGNGSTTGPVIDLGYEPQWLLIKNATGPDPERWHMFDNMRGMPVGGQPVYLYPNETSAEGISGTFFSISATGFQLKSASNATNSSGQTFIYIAIRRGPMKVPTSGTSVFAVSTASGEPAYSPLFTAGFSDMTLHSPRVSESGNGHLITDRLRGNGVILETPYTNAENTISTYFKYDSNDGAYIPNIGYFNNTGGTSKPYALRAFKRAPSFFDEVCYTGTGSARTLTHNLGVVPELMIVKRRDGTSYGDWLVYHSALGNTKYLLLNTTDASATANSGAWNYTNPTSTQFTVGDWESLTSTATYVAYLFATCAGVSKVGSYTGNGSSQNIDCGFTSGARFILIKRTDNSQFGDWKVFDSARGIVSGNDPYLKLNETDAEQASYDGIDPYSAGFTVNQDNANLNISSATYIFLAIA